MLQISDMLDEPTNAGWIQRLALALVPLLTSPSTRLGRSDLAIGQREHGLSSYDQTQLSENEATTIVEAVKVLPEHVQDSVMRELARALGGFGAALRAVHDTHIQMMLLSASRTDGGASLCVDINAIGWRSDGESCEEVFPLALLADHRCGLHDLKHLELQGHSTPDGDSADARAAAISRSVHKLTFSKVLTLTSQLTRLKLTHVGFTPDTLDALTASSGLMGSLDTLCLTGALHSSRALASMADLLQAATALRRLEYIDIVAPGAPVTRTTRQGTLRVDVPLELPSKPERKRRCQNLARMLSAAARLTHLTLRTGCVRVAAQIELPHLQHLRADCGICLCRHHSAAPVPVHRALLCPAADTVDLRLHPCEHSDTRPYRGACHYSDFSMNNFPEPMGVVMLPPVPVPQHEPCFPAAHSLSVGAHPTLGWCRLWMEIHCATQFTPGETLPLLA